MHNPNRSTTTNQCAGWTTPPPVNPTDTSQPEPGQLSALKVAPVALYNRTALERTESDSETLGGASSTTLAQRLAAVLGTDGNAQCFTCGSARPSWASINNGVLLCISCCYMHRHRLGVHISLIRSLDMDHWSDKQLRCLEVAGNSKIKRLWTDNSFGDPRLNPSWCCEGAEALRGLLAVSHEWSPLMVAVDADQVDAVELLLTDGCDPRECKCSACLYSKPLRLISEKQSSDLNDTWNDRGPSSVLLEGKHTYSAVGLARKRSSTPSSIVLFRSVQWSHLDPYAIRFFPPQFRRGVRHVCGLKVAVDRELKMELGNAIWLWIISHLPREFGF